MSETDDGEAGLAGLPAAYYLPLGGGRYRATDATTSPWDDGAQHGGPPTALLAACIDDVARADLRLARISMDFLGAMPKADLDVAVEVLRPGRRVQLAQATLSAGGRPVACARTWHLAVGAPAPPGARPDPPVPATVLSGSAPEPVGLPGPQPQRFFGGLERWGYGQATEWRAAAGGFEEASGVADMWTRVRIPLIEGRPLTGLDRLLVVADSANGVSAPLALSEWLFVPPGVTVHVRRLPVGPWVRLKARSDAGTDGIGLTEGWLSDGAGPCATVTQPLLVAPR